jgi:hypothetical protein
VYRDYVGGVGETQSFNFNVELINSQRRPQHSYGIKVVIDPDIGNTGNTTIP